MDWYELLKTLHILAIASWFGSGLAITVLGARSLAVPAVAGPFYVNAGWWASRAHPAAGVILLLTGFGMVGDADFIDFGDTWVWLGVVGVIVTMGIGGALIGRNADQLTKALESDPTLTPELRPLADKVILFARVELAILVLVIADMVAKPGA